MRRQKCARICLHRRDQREAAVARLLDRFMIGLLYLRRGFFLSRRSVLLLVVLLLRRTEPGELPTRNKEKLVIRNATDRGLNVGLQTDTDCFHLFFFFVRSLIVGLESVLLTTLDSNLFGRRILSVTYPNFWLISGKASFYFL